MPEDTAPPLEVIRMVYEATPSTVSSEMQSGEIHPTSKGRRQKTAAVKKDGATPQILIRKWLKLLIDRSLVLGSVDRPQLHDIVLEFVIAQFKPEELREAQHKLVIRFKF